MNARHGPIPRGGAPIVLPVLPVLLVLLCVLALVWLPRAPSSAAGVRAAQDGSIEIQLLEAPSSRRDDPRALAYVVDHLRPGTTIERAFSVTNHTAERQRVQLYAGPAEIRDGQFVGGDPGTGNELTSWVTTSLPRVGLAPGESTVQTLRIQVPSDASRGERYGVLWASVRSRDRGDVRMVNRVGIRIYLDVGRGGEPPSGFTIDAITPGRGEDGRPTLTAAVTNSGGRALDIRGEVRLRRGPGGLKAGPFQVSTATTLAPGDSGSVGLALDPDLPAGPWRARFDLRSGQVQQRAAATVTFPEAGTGPAVDAEPDPDAGGSVWWLALIGAVLGALAVLALLLLLRRRPRRGPEPGPEHAPVPGTRGGTA